MSGVDPVEIAKTFETIHSLFFMGIIFSSLRLISYRINNKVADHVSFVNKEDPNFAVKFEQFFQVLFDPVGMSVAEQFRSNTTRKITYHLSVNLLTAALAVSMILISGGAVIGIAFASYQLGVSFDATSFYRHLTASILVFSFATMSYATEKAEYAESR